MSGDIERIYVFVVCGSQEHIDTLHYSLLALGMRSAKRIIVVTDSTRNEVQIAHPEIIDIKTPEYFDHHQASIYLKTGLYKFIPSGNLYCYLDTDVVAVGLHVDSVFDNYAAPITFAPDHCVSDQFSPTAIKCSCSAEFAFWEKELKTLFLKHKEELRQVENAEKKEKLLKFFEEAKKNKLRYWLLSLRFNMARNVFALDDDTFLDKKQQLWHDKEGAAILYEADVPSREEKIMQESDYRVDSEIKSIWTINGKNVFDCRCNHLKQAIKETFDIYAQDEKWQHWNGGVFLFDDRSHDFLNAWHEKTLKIFTLPQWKTRDQGTLIATVWQFQLQHHPMLNRRFNLIADYLHRDIEHLGNLVFLFKKEQQQIKPEFVHVYHHWADKRWDVWQDVEKATGIEIDPDTQTINSLWIGKSLSNLEMLTIYSFLALGYRFRLWLYEPLENKLPEGVIVGDANSIIPKERVFAYRNKNKFGHGKGSYAGFSDIFRYKMLYEKGGWWTDMDVTCLKALDFDQPYFFRNHHELKVVGNLMKCPPKSQLMRACYEEAVECVTQDNTDWHKPIDILNENIERLNLEKYIRYNVSNEDMWDVTSKYIWHDEVLPVDWYFIHWQNEEWRSKKVDRNNFYFKSAIAALMWQYNLIPKPKGRVAEIINKLRHSALYRKLANINM